MPSTGSSTVPPSSVPNPAPVNSGSGTGVQPQIFGGFGGNPPNINPPGSPNLLDPEMLNQLLSGLNMGGAGGFQAPNYGGGFNQAPAPNNTSTAFDWKKVTEITD